MVQRDLATGRYATVDAYIAEAVELLHERDYWQGESLEEERRKLEEAWQQAERGELMSVHLVPPSEAIRAVIVAYAVDPRSLRILRVVHGARDISRLFPPEHPS